MSTHEYPKEMIDPGDDAPVAPADPITDWHACGMDYAFTEATDKSASDDWTTDDIAKAFQAGARLAQRTASVGDKPATSEPGAYAVWWGVGSMRVNSVHLERATAEQVASEIKSRTEIRPLSYTAPPDVQRDADRFTQAIQLLNSIPYALTKDECIQAIRELRDAAMVAKAST